ncbi:MAG: extracellular solute-binding protein, partial [Clostridia bacterium]|nr:extracellular solute-binding protein [Clostridia bacterium]
TAPHTGAQSETSEGTAAAVTEALSPEQQALTEALRGLDGVDMGGYNFRIMDRNSEESVNWMTIDVWAESETGDTITDAVYQRNRYLEENMNIVISEIAVQKPAESAKTAIMAGTDMFDVFTDGLTQLSSMAVEGYLTDLIGIETLKLTECWWDQEMRTDLSVAEKLFYITGDISIMDNYGTWCVMFNKNFITDYDLDDPYALVRNGTWTLDVMYDMAKTVSADLDGNGRMDTSDQWGFLTESFNEYGLWASGGQRIIGKDESDYPMLTMMSDQAVSVIDHVSEMMNDTAVTQNASNIDDGYTINNEHFGSGHALFIYGGMWLITKYRGYNVEFGILPAPKFDAAQDRYYNTYSNDNCTAYSIPLTAENPEQIGQIMEAMAEISKYTLTPAYYEKALKGKYLRDEESAEMLDIILSQRWYDLGMIFDWGDLFSKITELSQGSKLDFASTYEKRRKAAQREIDDYISLLDALK